MDDDRHRHRANTCCRGSSSLRFSLDHSIPLVHFATFLGDNAGFVLEGLLLKVLEGFPDSGFHIPGLSDSDQRADAGVDRDFRLMTALFDDENDLGIESIAQDFANFAETNFYFFAIGGSYFIVPARVFHSHGTSKVRDLPPALQHQL